MRFLVDRCAGRRLAEWLRGEGHDVVESRSLGADPGDSRLLELAAQDRRVLITIDTDFGRLVFLERQAHTGLVRLPDVRAEYRIELMRQVLEHHQADLQSGASVTVRGTRMRVSRPRD